MGFAFASLLRFSSQAPGKRTEPLSNLELANWLSAQHQLRSPGESVRPRTLRGWRRLSGPCRFCARIQQDYHPESAKKRQLLFQPHRGPGRTNLRMTLSKNTAISERVNVEIRMDAFNVFNHGEFANPDTNLFDGTFGQITTTTFGTSIVNPPTYTERIVQLAGRLTF